MEIKDSLPTYDYSKNVKKLYAYAFLANFHLWIPIYILFLQQERGISLTMIAVMEGLGWIATALFEVPTGAVADRFGRKVSLMIGGLTLGPIIILYGIVEYFPLLLLIHILWNACMAFASGADSALLYDSLKASGREVEYSKVIGRQMAMIQLASGSAGVLGAWLATYWMALPFIFCGLGVCMAAFVAYTLREPPADVQNETEKKLPYLQTILQAIKLVYQFSSLRNLMLLFAFLGIIPFFYTFFSVQPYVQGEKLDIIWLGPIFLALRGAAILGSMSSHRISTFLGNRVMVYGLPVMLIIHLLLLMFVPVKAGIAVLLSLNFIWSMSRPYWNTTLNRLIPSGQRATILSLLSLLQTLILAFIVPILGNVLEQFGYARVCLLMIILIIVVASILLVKLGNVKNIETSTKIGT